MILEVDFAWNDTMIHMHKYKLSMLCLPEMQIKQKLSFLEI